MPLLDHFHPPLHGPRRWEGFHHSWAAMIAQQLNEVLPPDYFAESEISLAPELEIDVAAMEETAAGGTVAAVGWDELASPTNVRDSGGTRSTRPTLACAKSVLTSHSR